jgi:hypothetical protein
MTGGGHHGCHDRTGPLVWTGPDPDRPELTVLELRSGAYEQTAHVTGDDAYRAAVPFPVTIVPAALVTPG